VIVVIAWLFFNWLVPQQSQPAWAREARSTVYLNQIGNWILAQLPEDPERALEQFRRRREGEGGAPQDQPPGSGTRPATPPAPQQRSEAPGPTRQDRQDLDQLVRGTQTTQPQPAR
jgi:membrane protein required for colicin V production